MVAEVWSGTVRGIQGELITVQADISDGLPLFGMTGHLSSEVKEAKDRVRTALKNTGYHLPPKRVSVNLAPADMILPSQWGFSPPCLSYREKLCEGFSFWENWPSTACSRR